MVADAKRIVITGLGPITPIGIGVAEFWQNAISGIDGISEVTHFDTSAMRSHRGGVIKNFEPSVYLSDPERFSRCTQLALAATKLALQHARLFPDFAIYEPQRRSVCLGTTLGEIEAPPKDESAYRQRCSGSIVRNLAQEFELHGEC